MTDYIYGARDKVTGKLVSDIVSPRRKYWDRKGNAEKSINAHNNAVKKGYRYANEVELVEFELTEKGKENNNLEEQLKLLNFLLSIFDSKFSETEKAESRYLKDSDDDENEKDLNEAFYEGKLNGISACTACTEKLISNIKRLI